MSLEMERHRANERKAFLSYAATRTWEELQDAMEDITLSSDHFRILRNESNSRKVRD